jgi:hypothetical protein
MLRVAKYAKAFIYRHFGERPQKNIAKNLLRLVDRAAPHDGAEHLGLYVF